MPDGVAPRARTVIDSSLLEFRGVSVAHDRDLGCGTVDFGHVAAGELDGCSAKVFLQPGQLGGSRDRHDPGGLSEEPGQRQLGWGGALSLAGSAQPADQGLVRPARPGREARQFVAVIGAVEGGVLVDSPGEEAAPQRAVRHEPYAQLRADRSTSLLGSRHHSEYSLSGPR